MNQEIVPLTLGELQKEILKNINFFEKYQN